MKTPSKTPSQIAEDLANAGISICENFLSTEEVIGCRRDVARLKAEGLFHRAGVGHGGGFQLRDSVRRDEIYWLDRAESNTIQDAIWTKLDTLQTAFNQSLYLGLNHFEGHYATYESGGFYRRHFDSFADSILEEETRVVSLIVYLNENWQSEDAGKLRVYSENSHLDVAPIGGTLVCFMSRESEHEVLLSQAPRISFAGWFGRRRSHVRTI